MTHELFWISSSANIHNGFNDTYREWWLAGNMTREIWGPGNHDLNIDSAVNIILIPENEYYIYTTNFVDSQYSKTAGPFESLETAKLAYRMLPND
jgi:hypothetical protein